ncbi:MAG: hypothetical protein CSA84_04945 [Actinomycetales bacterium]|nr:MAG: hypothetical protein CSA84_04945 [Actinomycetales bacterium]
MIKRLIQETEPGRFGVRDDGPLSAPSFDLGPVAVRDMVGHVVFTISPPKAERNSGEGRPKRG